MINTMTECVERHLHTNLWFIKFYHEHETVKKKKKEKSHHVEIGADFDSSGQVPHDAIPIMSC